jgi:pimeloyl-ACP methyl ester carboxylesterase/predicted glycosyltransferase
MAVAEGERMRAREPDEQGYVDHDGVKLAYEIFGSGDTTVLFPPVDTIVDSRVWKGQVAYLAQHVRVVTVDPPGNGRSDRPLDPAAYDDLTWVGDTLAVLDGLGIERAFLVGICYTGWLSLLTASLHPDRVAGVIAVAPYARDETPPLPFRAEAAARFDDELGSYDGWDKFNRHHWRDDWEDFARFFFGQLTCEPHSTKVFEDAVEYALGTTGEIMLAAQDATMYAATPEEGLRVLQDVRCPVLVISGTEDRCQPVGRFETVVRETNAEHLVMAGAGHLPMARYPVLVNRTMKRFVDRVTGVPEPRTSCPGGRRQRALYLSSPIGLGHARRDLAIADAMREARPDLEVQWLTQSPVAEFLERRGEVVHPASRLLASESTHFESESGEHDLHAFQAVRRMDEVLVNNFMVFDDLVERESFDLWLGDEAWELDHFLHEHPELKRAPFVWMTDFVGWVPMADGGDREAFLTSDYNAEMVEHVARYPHLRDRSVFVGDPGDVVDQPLGPGLPGIREWTEQHFDFAGYVMGERPDPGRREELRERLGYLDGEVVCVVSVGGSGVGNHLLRRVVASYDEARRRIDGLRMVVVAGPRIDPASLGVPQGVEVHGFLPDLDLHHAACDVAVVQGGLSTTMELTAAGRPFLYVPLGHHFEQQVHVRHRLERHRAGRPLDYRDADPGRIADELVEALRSPVDYVPVPTDGAERAARLVLELV